MLENRIIDYHFTTDTVSDASDLNPSHPDMLLATASSSRTRACHRRPKDAGRRTSWHTQGFRYARANRLRVVPHRQFVAASVRKYPQY